MFNTLTEASTLAQLQQSASTRWIARSSLLTMALAAAYPNPGFAQAADAQPTAAVATVAAQVAPVAAAAQPAADAPAQIESVVVTARRVVERLQEIPASVSAITGDKVANMPSLADIQSMVSGVTFKTFGPIPTVGIRGYGNRTVAGNTTNSTVGIFQDGVFVAPPLVVIASRIDTERVEVAKGPQSTLYGRSSFTGAINLVTNDPAKDFGGSVDVGLGQSSVHGENLWHVRGAISAPINDDLSIRFFGLREKRDGYTYDSSNGNRGNGYDREVGRVKVLWQPSKDITARLTLTGIKDNLPLGLVHTGQNPAPAAPGGVQQVIFGNNANPAIPAAIVYGKDVWDATKQYALPVSGKTNGQQATLDLRIQTPFGELASLTDYQHSEQDLKVSLDLTPLNIARGDTPFEEHRKSQELRLSNQVGAVSYLLGAYYLKSQNAQAGDNGPDPAHPSILLNPGALLYDNPFVRRNIIYQPSNLQTKAHAVFGQLGVDLTKELNVTFGLRKGHEGLSGSAGTYFGTIAGAIIPAPAMTYREASFDATTGNVNASFKFTPEIVGYASFSKGNSPGGFNSGAFATAQYNYSPQKVDAFEIGIKSQLFDRRLQLNAALFDNKYSDLHLVQNAFVSGALVSRITNAGKASGRGLDLDAVGVLSKEWRAGLQYTYADSKITHYDVLPLPALQVDFTGVPLVRSPKHSANASLTYKAAVGPGRLNVTVDESYTSSYTNDYQGVPATATAPQKLALYRTPGYATTNVTGSYSWGDWTLSGYVRNLGNRQYIASVLSFDAVSYPQELPGEPRTIGVALKFQF
jgi:iron complex outermembrane receptor protein